MNQMKIFFFLKTAYNTTGNKIKILRSDNGLEFVNNNLKRILDSKGIRHQTTVAYSPEQNGKVEREMRTIVEAARTMLCTKQLEKHFWAEAVNTAVYIINRTGTSSIDGKTPYELWHNKTVNLNNFKVFGAEVYVHIPKEKRHKWDAKGRKGMFVCYEENTKEYRIYIQDENRVECARDVVFLPEKKEET